MGADGVKAPTFFPSLATCEVTSLIDEQRLGCRLSLFTASSWPVCLAGRETAIRRPPALSYRSEKRTIMLWKSDTLRGRLCRGGRMFEARARS